MTHTDDANTAPSENGKSPCPPAGLRPTGLARPFVAAIRLYQRLLSPLVPPRCRFRPTCSQYMIEAVIKKGIVRGMLKGCWRIMRCHPFSRGGYDPVE